MAVAQITDLKKMDSPTKSAQYLTRSVEGIGIHSTEVYFTENLRIRSGREQEVRPCETLVIILPLYHNPDPVGTRAQVESEKIETTEKEIRKQFSGYTKSLKEGWYHDKEFGDDYFDQNIQYEIDGPVGEFDIDFLIEWKCSLESRFQQRSIYMKLSGPNLLL